MVTIKPRKLGFFQYYIIQFLYNFGARQIKDFCEIIFMIISRQNNNVKFIKSLQTKKGRIKEGCYLVEGEKMVKEAFLTNRRVKMVLGEPEMVKNYLSCVETIEATREILEYCSDTMTPQGICAAVEFNNNKPTYEGNVVLLDGISDPGNMGTIIRTCAAVGIKNLILINCCDPYSTKCVRSSMSGIFHVDIEELDYETALSKISGKDIIVADMSGENVFNFSSNNFCLVVGNEAHGVSEFMKNKANVTVSIPMKNTMESLNAGVSCSIILYELSKNNF